jgi:hypothetical protein
MRTVKIRSRQADLSREMQAMRAWLDQNRYEPKRFECKQEQDGFVFLVEFMVDAQAEAFAFRFRQTPS